MIAIRLEELSHEFDDRVVFDGLDFEFTGSCLAVTGPNGSGKSTLLRVLAGLISPTSGRASLLHDGKALSRDERRSLAGLAAASVRLYTELTVRENLSFLLEVRVSGDAARVDAVLEEVGLAGRADDCVGELSAGLSQRAALAAAMVHSPKVLLLDEPTANLDEAGIETVRSLIEKRRRAGLVVIATNDPREAALGEQRLHLGAAQ